MADQYPLDWPHGRPRTDEPESSPFFTRDDYRRKKKSFGDARSFMEGELERLAKDQDETLGHYMLSANIKRRKNDGMPYANHREPDDSGVAIYYTIGEEQRCFTCDRWDRVADNTYAIGRTIAALRQISRDGAGRDFEVAYEAASSLLPEATSGMNWWEVLGISKDPTKQEIESAWRDVAAIYHTDNQKTGNREKWDEAQEARKQALEAIGVE